MTCVHVRMRALNAQALKVENIQFLVKWKKRNEKSFYEKNL